MKKHLKMPIIAPYLIGAIILILLFTTKLADVTGQSMAPTATENDRVIITKFLPINRFDIIVAKTEIEQTDNYIVKRVIGLPGETIKYQNNKLYIDDKFIEEEFLEKDSITTDNNGNMTFEYKLGDDEYYVLGDNRDNSYDSRYLGPIKKSTIIGNVIYIMNK